MKNALSQLLQHPKIWQASAVSPTEQCLPTGHNALNQALHLGGWPLFGLSELICHNSGIGEMQLLRPTLAQLSQQTGYLLLIAPPCVPYGPAWQYAGIRLSQLRIIQPRNHADLLWATEQALRSPACAAVISWLDKKARANDLRKLQLAAQAPHNWGVIFRHKGAEKNASPVSLRITLHSQGDSLALKILKQRGGWSGQQLQLDLQQALQFTQQDAADWPVYHPATSHMISNQLTNKAITPDVLLVHRTANKRIHENTLSHRLASTPHKQ